MDQTSKRIRIFGGIIILMALLAPAFLPAQPAAAATGAVWTWGRDAEEQLANGPGNSGRNVPGPALLNGAQLTDFKALGAGTNFALAVKNDGTVWTWGADYYGQLGDGTRVNPDVSTVPQQVPNLNHVVAVTGGYDHSIALKDDGTVWAWGSDYYGQLGSGVAGNPNGRNLLAPSKVINLTNVIAVASAAYQNLAVKSDGTVWAWGDFCHALVNAPGSPGYYDCPTAVQVAGVDNIKAVAFSSTHALALRNDGVVISWGANSFGELGRAEGTGTITRQLPAPIGGLSNVTSIAAGPTYSIALTGDGAVWAWGRDDQGQFGDGEFNNPGSTFTPTRVPGLSNITKIGTAHNYIHIVALRNDGALFTWGWNGHGQLGTGSVEGNVPAAHRVYGLTGVTDFAAGTAFTMALGSYAPLPEFGDLANQSNANVTAIQNLARLGIIKGCDPVAGSFCPNDPTLRAQMAALIARSVGWDAEDHNNTFPDRCLAGGGCIDDDLWRNVGTLQFYGVAKGFQDGTYSPFGEVLYAQSISFITRAMVNKGYWIQATNDDGSIYPNIPAESGHRLDFVTYTQYVGPVPGTASKTQNFAEWNKPSTRAWFALALWQAIKDR